MSLKPALFLFFFFLKLVLSARKAFSSEGLQQLLGRSWGTLRLAGESQTFVGRMRDKRGVPTLYRMARGRGKQNGIIEWFVGLCFAGYQSALYLRSEEVSPCTLDLFCCGDPSERGGEGSLVCR